MAKNWEYYTYEAMNILIRPNVKEAIIEIASRCGISNEDAKTLVQKYKQYDYQDACSLEENKEYFYGKVKVINWVATEIQLRENNNENENNILK